ncbi:MAG: viral A-type inclusion protein [Sebaldella sp.]|nr:viral A-type inclusion protein [Sebaldella sp.]
MRKVLLKITILLFLFNISFSYSDYYYKVYTIKVNKTEIFDFINATEKQRNSLTKVFDKYQKQANELSTSTVSYSKKVQKLNALKKDRKNEIYKVLSHEQIKKYNTYINEKNLEFKERNNKISELLSTLDLSNQQESDILKYEKDFQRKLDDLQSKNISNEDFMSQYEELKTVRNKSISSALTDDQLKIVENKKFF